MNKNTPRLITIYLLKEFSFNIIIFFIIFISLIFLLSYIQELIFFKDQEISEKYYLNILILTLAKVPSIIITISPFIFLFASVFFYSKLLNNNEISPIKLSGLSDTFLTLIPAGFSFFIGTMFVLIITPISSELTKYYEGKKQKFSKNENLIILSNTGIWLKEKRNDEKYIIRADKVESEDFKNLKNITIHRFDKLNNYKERIDGDKVVIEKNRWTLNNVRIIANEKNEKLNNLVFETEINFENLKNFFTNANTFSIWNIFSELKKIRERGYYGHELIIALNKYLSLPFLLFAMTFLSTLYTLKLNIRFNNFIYIFLCIMTGILVYFLMDLSIAIGRSGKLPLILSVWMPVIIFLILPLFSLMREEQ